MQGYVEFEGQGVKSIMVSVVLAGVGLYAAVVVAM